MNGAWRIVLHCVLLRLALYSMRLMALLLENLRLLLARLFPRSAARPRAQGLLRRRPDSGEISGLERTGPCARTFRVAP
jgi:hypothetical protein